MIVWMHGDDSSDPEHCKYLRLTVLNGHSYSRNLRVLLLAIWAGIQRGGPETAFEAPVTSAKTAEFICNVCKRVVSWPTCNIDASILEHHNHS
jgi:hypothetical protein